MTQATEPTTADVKERPGEGPLVSVSDTSTNENYHDHDNRNSQEYWGSLVLNFPVSIGASAFPPYGSEEEGKWARGIWSKFNHMLGSACTMGHKIAVLNLAGLAEPSEVGLDEDGRSLDLPPEVPSSLDLSEEGNPVTGEAFRPFDELRSLDLMVGLTYSRYPEQTPEDESIDAVVKLELRARVERPSMIPSLTALRGAASKVRPEVLGSIRAALPRALELVRRRAAVRRNVHVSTNVARIWTDHFTDEAREKINYKERLEALHEELRGEIDSQIEEYFQETTDEELAEDLNAPVSAIRTAKRVWENYSHVGSGLSPATSNVDPAEVLKDLGK
jgi:hypothetical protein